MHEKMEYAAAMILIAFGSQWAIRFFQNYKSKSQVKRDEIDSLKEIIEALRQQVFDLKGELKELRTEMLRKDKAYQLSYQCKNTANCPVLKELNK